MAIDYSQMTPEQLIAYLTQQYGNVGPITGGPQTWTDNGPSGGYSAANETGLPPVAGNRWESLPGGGFQTPLTSAYDQVGAGGQYGYQLGQYAPSGELTGTEWRPAERSGGWWDENAQKIVPAAIASMIGYGLLGPGAGGMEQAGSVSSPSLAGGAGADVIGGGSSLADFLGSAAVSPEAMQTGYAGFSGLTGVPSVANTGLSEFLRSASANPETLQTATTAATGASWIDKLLSNPRLLSTVGGAGVGLLDSLTAPDSRTITEQKTTDPRVDAAIWGDAGFYPKLLEMLSRAPTPAMQGSWGIANNYFTAPRR